MKCTIPEISWHNRDPVLSIDVQPQSEHSKVVRLATGGTDSHVLIWYVTAFDESSASIEIAADLTRHEKAVNVVRWSPSGQLLASGDDDSVIMIWKQRTDADPPLLSEQNSEGDKEIWMSIKILRGHIKDVYDISWSPNSQFLISGSVDNTAIIWDFTKGRSTHILDDHKNFVQGVAWDPNNQYVATMSSDRTCRMFDIKTKKNVCRSSKGKPINENNQSPRLYHDDTLQSFFRRLCFSPDGLLLIVPSGVLEKENGKILNTTYIYSKYSPKLPIVTLPSKEYSVAAKCCPLLFCLRSTSPIIPLPYRMIIAIATRSSVILYDTEQSTPFAMISNIHYTRLTDLSWSSDGTILAVSSTDGFCSIINFTKNELGEIYRKDSMEDVKNSFGNSEKEKLCMETQNLKVPPFDECASDGMDIENKIITTQMSSEEAESAEDIRLVIEDTQTMDTESVINNRNESMAPEIDINSGKDCGIEKNIDKDILEVDNKKDCITAKTPRRVKLITLSSPKIRMK